jgi:Zn-dependent alcohol dehydrogenase
MKAAVCNAYGKPLDIEEVTLEPPKDNEVKVRVVATAICHSDIHSIKGEHAKGELPGLPGHEVAGYVEAIGKDVTYVQPGDPVVCCLVRSGCGHCHYCIIGLPHFCENWHFEFLRPGPYLNHQGRRMTLFSGGFAGFAEYTNVYEDALVKIPADMPMDRACLLACGVISGFGAVVNAVKVQPFSSVMVVGTGGVGLNAIQGAAFVGAHPIIAADIRDDKLETARAFGATHTINMKTEQDPMAAAKAMTHGRGVDYAFMTVAGIGPKRQAFSMLSRVGVEVLIGHGTDEFLSDFNAVEFVGGKIMTGCAMGASRIRVDIPRLIELYQAGRLKLDELITRRYSFDQINEAISDAEEGKALRNVIIF